MFTKEFYLLRKSRKSRNIPSIPTKISGVLCTYKKPLITPVQFNWWLSILFCCCITDLLKISRLSSRILKSLKDIFESIKIDWFSGGKSVWFCGYNYYCCYWLRKWQISFIGKFCCFQGKATSRRKAQRCFILRNEGLVEKAGLVFSLLRHILHLWLLCFKHSS